MYKDNDLTPKMPLSKAAEFLDISVQAVHRQLKSKNLNCPKIGNKLYLNHGLAKQLFEIKVEPKKISCHVVKGGTGKTTTTQNIATCANSYGLRVLQIDIDPQANLTDSYNINADESPVLVDLINEKAEIADSIISICEGLDIIPSRIENVVLDNTIINARTPLHNLFNLLLQDIEQNYDLILIDCPPTMGQVVTAANLYADMVLAPLNPDKFSVKGLKILQNEILLLSKKYKTTLEFKVFLNKFSGNTILSDKTLSLLLNQSDMENKVLQTAVRFSQEIPNTTAANKSMFSSLKSSPTKMDFDQLTREILGIVFTKDRIKKKIN
jgi:chromosome partitioning protein